MTDNLFYFQIGMFFGCIVVKQGFKVINEVMLLVGNFKIGHYDVVGSIRPAVIIGVVDAVCFAGKVKSLEDELAVLLEERSPLN